MAQPDRDRDWDPELVADLDELRRLEPPAEDAERRRRIVLSVLDHAASHTVSSAPRRRARLIASAALAVAAVLCAMWIAAEHTMKAPPRAALETPRAEPMLRVTSGSIEAGGSVLHDAATIGASTALKTGGEPAVLVLVDASVLRAAPSTTFVYTAVREERFVLERGRVSLEVEARAPHRPLVVETDELSAWVVGTRFDVARDEARDERRALFSTTVSVTEGVVRVVAKATGEVRLLAAGEQITLRAASGAAADLEARPVQERDPAVEPPAAAARKPVSSVTGTETRGQHALAVEIRRHLREGATGAARRLIQRAERERAVSSVELSLLQAETDLAERRYDRAKTRYLAIVAEYSGTPEAELALFAAAQLSRGKAGLDLLQRYLARYPEGRFAKEAHRLLEALDQPRRED